MALRDGTARFGDQEAFYLEWTEGAYHHLRVMPLTEEYYCPQVPLTKDGAVWTTSWSFKRDAAYTRIVASEAPHGGALPATRPRVGRLQGLVERCR